MKFLYSDTQDYVDPTYDFINDRPGLNRERYWTDAYAHELMTPVPYDGLLVSMSAVREASGVAKSKVRYDTGQEQRLLRDGARKFLRFGGPKCKDLMVMGDCGAFAYVTHEKPPFTPVEVVDFYAEADFTHGISPDHIIFDCDVSNPRVSTVPQQIRDRFDITLENAKEFLRLARKSHVSFAPIGAVQGWSPASMAEAAARLEKMGYRYLAIGGLVPLKVNVIKAVLQAIRERIKPSTDIHLLGFAKADRIHEFTSYGITSFDSTSPLIRAFKDEKSNYFMDSPNGGLEYFTAIRIPQATENTRLQQASKRGLFVPEDLQKREQLALATLRAFDRGQASSQSTLDAVMDYHWFLFRAASEDAKKVESDLAKTRALIQRTIEEVPWKRCTCDICRSVGVEVIIFRASNRNKRRGFHNLGVYHKHLKRTMENAK
jgi:hypothetical protein